MNPDRAPELLLGRAGRRRCAALREEGSTVELYLEPDEPVRWGRIARARVERVMSGIQSVVVDTGLGRHALVAASDLVLPDEPPGRRSAPVQDRIRAGRDLLVQIIRESTRERRGDRATTDLRIAGRRLVLLPLRSQAKVSRRIAEARERERLLEWIEGRSEAGRGWIVRTAAAGVAGRELDDEAARLIARLETIRARSGQVSSPGPVDEPVDFLAEIIRDAPAGLGRLVVDGVDDRERTEALLRSEAPDLLPALELHRGPPGVTEAYGLVEEFRAALDPRAPLPSGGSVVVEHTEALVTVDVNTGSADGPDALTRTNLEAARELARQLRLRDVGGSVVVDFAGGRCTDRVLSQLDGSLRADPARTRIAGRSELGLVHITRDARRGAAWLRWTTPCSGCAGAGRVPGEHLPFGPRRGT